MREGFNCQRLFCTPVSSGVLNLSVIKLVPGALFPDRMQRKWVCTDTVIGCTTEAVVPRKATNAVVFVSFHCDYFFY